MSRKTIDWYREPASAQSAAAAGTPPLPERIEQGRAPRPVAPGLFSVAPMIDKTNRHFRWFVRQMTKRAVLYTEMVTAPAIIHGRRERLLDFDPIERPLVLQLGGDDPAEIAEALRIAEDWDYDEYNLNVGCPSDKVQQGSFGACLMADPRRVADIVSAMAAATRKPVTVKHRIGIEGFGYHRRSFEEMVEFVAAVAQAGCERFIVHARVAMLEGLSPRENRSVPPIRYEDVYRLKALYPGLRVELNGQVRSLSDCAAHLGRGVDGLMVGRASYERPQLLAGLDEFERRWADPAADARAALPAWAAERDAAPAFDRRALVLRWAEYVEARRAEGVNPRSLVWPVLDLFPGERGSRRFRQLLSENVDPGSRMPDLARRALSFMPDAV